jgi:hypothetical protein
MHGIVSPGQARGDEFEMLSAFINHIVSPPKKSRGSDWKFQGEPESFSGLSHGNQVSLPIILASPQAQRILTTFQATRQWPGGAQS